MRADVQGPADVVARVCGALLREDCDAARAIAVAEYPFIRHANTGRKYTELQSMRVFLRDRFTDRYSGARLVFPATLRLLSKVMPEEFPAHPNWKMSDCHIVYWELFPTIDHVVPVARGGSDDEPNWVTTSMLRNAAKSNWTLGELGWSLRSVDPDDAWDGLVCWCLDYLAAHPEHLSDKYIARWHRAALTALETST
ncbi:MAG TPA: HNH endonuclease [bacterium]|nr:HNH endonuclease [bacterium]